MSEENRFLEFLDKVDAAIIDALDNGTTTRLSTASEKNHIIIDIYRAGGSMKTFNEVILGAAKEARGMKVIE